MENLSYFRDSIFGYAIFTALDVGLGDSATILDSWECRKCYLLKVSFKSSDLFDHQDFVEVEFSDPLREVTGWSYPVESATRVGNTERWRIGFNSKADLRETEVNFSVNIKIVKRKPEVISMRTCPCSGNGNGNVQFSALSGYIDETTRRSTTSKTTTTTSQSRKYRGIHFLE